MRNGTRVAGCCGLTFWKPEAHISQPVPGARATSHRVREQVEVQHFLLICLLNTYNPVLQVWYLSPNINGSTE